jgi:uncharacterized protein YbbC (DUF1343 family)
MPVLTGIDLLAGKPRTYLKSKKLKTAALCHPPAATRHFKHLIDILGEQSDLIALFGPQHGIRGETQDNMIEWEDQKDEKGRPIFSLYGERRKPSQQSLAGVETMVIDLFDVGARYYTFIYTMAYMLEVCGELGIPVIVLDRPNPIGGTLVEGPILNLEFKSFVGMYALPVCHGMTIGEIAKLFCDRIPKAPPLTVIRLKNWKRSMHFNETKLTWTMPSPNLPHYESVVVYPGMCLLEGTSLSEGRGTTRPFELIGAPFIRWDDVEREYQKLRRELQLSEVFFHRQGFIPTFHKFKGELCFGSLQIVPEPKRFLPLRHAVTLLWILRRLYGDQWKWKEPPYEYEYTKLPIDILGGDTAIRQTIDEGLGLKKLFKNWQSDEERFRKLRRPYLLYR